MTRWANRRAPRYVSRDTVCQSCGGSAAGCIAKLINSSRPCCATCDHGSTDA